MLKRAHDEKFVGFAGKRVLHFAPERHLRELVRSDQPADYTTADISPDAADVVLNIEAIDLPDECVDVILCSHVLEHVDDRLALRELHRILSPGGTLIVMVPIIEGWQVTYEDESILSPGDRFLHFGQEDHLRYFGADVRDRIRAAGFELDEYTALGAECVRYGLIGGDKVFRATKKRGGEPNESS